MKKIKLKLSKKKNKYIVIASKLKSGKKHNINNIISDLISNTKN